jgi:hypothetical protein
VWATICREPLQSHLHGRPCVRFPHAMPRGSRCGWVAGTPLVEAGFPSALAGRVACLCVAFASSRHAVPLRLLRSSPRVLRWTGEWLMASIALAVFGRSNGSRWRCPRSPRSIGRDLDLGLDSEGRLRTSASKVRLAIRTSRPYLSATSVRLEHIRILDHACEQHQADRCPCAGHSPWAPLRPAYRYPQLSMGDARPGRPVSDLGVTPRHAPQPLSTIGGAPGIQSPFAVLVPRVQGSGRLRSLQTPRAR